MKKAIIFGILAMFAVSATTVNAQIPVKKPAEANAARSSSNDPKQVKDQKTSVKVNTVETKNVEPKVDPKKEKTNAQVDPKTEKTNVGPQVDPKKQSASGQVKPAAGNEAPKGTLKEAPKKAPKNSQVKPDPKKQKETANQGVSDR